MTAHESETSVAVHPAPPSLSNFAHKRKTFCYIAFTA